MKFYLQQNVYDAALDRIRWLFDEFENLVVNFSGGKDSTVLLNLALKVAEEKGRLPLPVMFVDQEAEWETVIGYIRRVMNDPRVKPLWYQVPIKIFNATSNTDDWLYCWEPGKEWMRPQEPNSIKVNPTGTQRFTEFLNVTLHNTYGPVKAVNLAGVRCSESPARLKGLTSYETYKGRTWGSFVNKKWEHFVMYPLYDWEDTDIWKAIHDNGWEYCRIYDCMYQHGVPMRQMRVSNLNHETALASALLLQEIEGDTWNRLAKRLQGINTLKHLNKHMTHVDHLPFMFKSWKEYRDHLLETLIADEHKEKFRRQFAGHDQNYVPEIHEKLHKAHISALLVNDYHGTKMSTFAASNGQYSRNKGKFDDHHASRASAIANKGSA